MSILFAVWLCATARAQTAIRVDVNLVNLAFVAQDSQGKLVENLTRDDVELYVLNRNGICVIAGAKGLGDFLAHALAAPVLSRFVSQKFVTFIAKLNTPDLNFMRELMESGKVTPVLDRRYKLSEVPEAMRYLETRRARGNSPGPGIAETGASCVVCV